jgi:hypothetical protein
MHPELSLVFHRERMAEAERDRSAREVGTNATPHVAFVIAYVERWFESVMSGTSRSWRRDLTVHIAVGSVFTPR